MKKYTAPLMLLLASFIWGIAFAAQKTITGIGPMTVTCLRNAIAFLFITPLVPLMDKLRNTGRTFLTRHGPDLTRTEIVGGLVCGSILAVASSLQQAGIAAGTDAGKASFITALYVVLVPLCGLFLRKRAPVNTWVSIAIAVVGFYLLCIKGNFTVAFSDLLVLLCALVFAVQIVTIDHFSPRCDGMRMSCVQFFASSAVAGILSLLFERWQCSLPAFFGSLGSLLILGVGSSGIAYTLQILGQKDTPPAAAAIILSLESVFGVLSAVVFLHERMTLREAAGCAIVFFAVLLSQLDLPSLLRRAREGKNPPPAEGDTTQATQKE